VNFRILINSVLIHKRTLGIKYIKFRKKHPYECRWALFAREINASTAFQPQLPSPAAFANFKQASITAPLPYSEPSCFLMSCFPYANQPLSVLSFPSYPVLHSLFRSIQGDRACLLHICGNYLQRTTAVISIEGSRTNIC
jgi:hypothetical protein